MTAPGPPTRGAPRTVGEPAPARRQLPAASWASAGRFQRPEADGTPLCLPHSCSKEEMGRPAPPPPARPPPAAPAPRPEPRPPFPAPPSGALFPEPPAAAQLSQFSLWGLLVTKDGSDTPPTPERKEERSLLEQPASGGEQVSHRSAHR
ncbi:unnamed protein product [Rangifer tarandus platyrhynchus]|uniref:Uncharacterized protein n=1 Tax=Rangifer tarandus platyrhynchus TaxID=3082113 RepID=A0AC59ZJP6_RANTA